MEDKYKNLPYDRIEIYDRILIEMSKALLSNPSMLEKNTIDDVLDFAEEAAEILYKKLILSDLK